MMKAIRWNHEKNDCLFRDRGVCFEQVALILERDETLDIIEHPNPIRYPGQKLFVVEIDSYAYLVPYVENEEEVFLKTMIPSRKATEKYLRRKK
jgi:hypothetical protein